MASLLYGRIIHAETETCSDDEYTYESYDYEMVDEHRLGEDQHRGSYYNKSTSSVSVETVEDDDDDEYTYEEILDVVMEEKENDMDSTVERRHAHGKGQRKSSSPTFTKSSALLKPPPNTVPVSPVNQTSPVVVPKYGLKEAPSLLTPSKQRAKAANSAGLSELSKQLRILQATNESHNVEINRLERQLRILADLQGISVGDLRKALEDACAGEAFAELQNCVSKLKYDLEAANMAKQAELRKDAAAPHIANLELRVGELEEVEEKQMMEIRDLYDGLRKEKAVSVQSESENQKLKGALQEMIHRAQSESARAAAAEANFQKQLQELRERQSKMMQNEAQRSRDESRRMGKSAQKGAGDFKSSIVSPEMAAEYEQMVQLLKKKDDELRKMQAKLHDEELRQAQTRRDTEEQAWKAHMDMKVKADKLALTVKELEDADGQNGLRLAQFKARFTVQEDRIIDMEQQLDSLYTAFDLLKEEFESDNNERVTMLSNLKEADAEIARQTKKKEEEKTAKSYRKPSPIASSSRNTSIDSSPGVATSRPVIATLAPASPATPVTARTYQSLSPYSNITADRSFDNSRFYDNSATPYSNNMSDKNHYDHSERPATYATTMFTDNTNDRNHYGYNKMPTAYATAQAVQPVSPQKASSTWELLANKDNRDGSEGNEYHKVEGQLICGSLIVESKGMLRKWKTRPCRIYLRGEGYQWDIGEKRSFPLQFGISKVEFHPNYPLSFAVCLDSSSPNAPTIRAAAVNEHDYHRWLTALYKATTGEEYQGGAGSTDLATLSTPSQARMPPLSHASANTRRPSKGGNFSHHSSPMSNRPMASAVRVDDSEDADLKRILELSKYET